jgi:hypothetical protein
MCADFKCGFVASQFDHLQLVIDFGALLAGFTLRNLLSDGALLIHLAFQFIETSPLLPLLINHAERRRILDGLDFHFGVALKADLPAHQCGQSHGDQHVRPTWQKAFEQDHQDQRGYAHDQGG